MENMGEVVLRLIKIEEELKTFVKKDEFNSFKNEVFNRFDDITGILKEMRQELTFVVKLYQRLDEKVENHHH